MRYAKTKYGEGSPVFEVEMDQTEFAEQTGYLTTRELVERFMEAGRRLSSYRKGLLDYDEGDDFEDQEAVNIYGYDEPTEFEGRISASQLNKAAVETPASVSEPEVSPQQNADEKAEEKTE